MYFSRIGLATGVIIFLLALFGFKHPELFIYGRRSAFLTHRIGEKASTTLGKYVGAPLGALMGIVLIQLGVSHEIMIHKAQGGDAAAQYALADCFYRGDFQGEDLEQALIWFRRAARNGHPEARDFIEDFRYHGAQMARDPMEAFAGYRLLAEDGEAWAQAKVGECYQHGFGVDKDMDEALTWYRQAAASGYNPARIRLAGLYDRGTEVPQDQGQAFRWYLAAARDGDVIAQGQVGHRYAHGIGTGQDTAAAIHWYERSASEGLPSSRINLGILYLKHFRNDSARVAEARRLFEQTVPLEPEACTNLGLMALRGVDRPPDRIEACAWFMLAAEQGSELGRRKGDNLAARMSPAQLEQARDLRRTLEADYFRPPTEQEQIWIDLARSGVLEVQRTARGD